MGIRTQRLGSRVASINKNEIIFFKGMESLYAVDQGKNPLVLQT